MRILISVLGFIAYSGAMWQVQDNGYIIDLWESDESSPAEVHLSCSPSGNRNESVYWKHNNENNKLGRHDRSLKISVTDPPDAGNFTCWSNATNILLKYYNLYVAKITPQGTQKHQLLNIEESRDSSLKCTAKNYSGNFICTWKIAPESQNQRLKFAIRSQNNITCEDPIRVSTGQYSVSCKKEKSCQSAEEYQQTEIDLHVFDEDVYIYENDTARFFIKDILKPDAMECEYQIRRNRTSKLYQVTWDPPKTWDNPESYFRLKYEIKVVKPTEKTYEVDNPIELGNRLAATFYYKGNKNILYGNEIYIRSRDYYNTISAWSEWSKCYITEEWSKPSHS
ncbi:interleukin-12 subunit beta [Paroedura picta]|uniref:interleukin-12 subunit beta n=1 Tax=Paroedura picta TaxID=143630 RepID=UPI004055DD8B